MKDHFHCAATIAAYMDLTLRKEIEHDRELFPRSVTAQMVHLNNWAMPQGLREKDAFARVNEERDSILASRSAEEIVAEARACVEGAG